jgi:predicted acetyltransferase
MSIRLERLDASQSREHISLIVTALGGEVRPDGAERWAQFPELFLRLAARDDEELVGTLGGFHFDTTVPGGAAVPTVGLSVVAVRPTHRRRGVLTTMIQETLAYARAQNRPLSSLFASEASIYGRFGYGLASLGCDVAIDRHRSAFRADVPISRAAPRHLVREQALEFCPRVWEAVRPVRAGMLSRSKLWWQLRRIDEPEWRRSGRGHLQFAGFEGEDGSIAYAIYRFGKGFDHTLSTADHEAYEILGTSPGVVLAAWRFVLDLDLGNRITAALLPPDHPLLFALADPGALRLKAGPALWVRLVDVEGAFRARRMFAGAPVVVAVRDRLCPWNEGNWRFSSEGAVRTSDSSRLSLDVETLGALYMGGFTAQAFAQAGRVEAKDPEAALELDQLLGRFPSPWCPEMF